MSVREISPHTALGFIQAAISDDLHGAKLAIIHVAEANNLGLPDILVFGPDQSMPTMKLLEAVRRHRATTVITPASEHLGHGGVRAIQQAGRSILYSGALVQPAGWRR